MTFVPESQIDEVVCHDRTCAITSNNGAQTLYIRREDINNGRVSFSESRERETVRRALGSPNAHLSLLPATKRSIDQWFAGRI